MTDPKLLICIFISASALVLLMTWVRYTEWHQKRKNRLKERQAMMAREYDDIRSLLALCTDPNQIKHIDQRIRNFEHNSMNILPHELHVTFCDHLESLLDKKIDQFRNVRWMREQLIMN